MAIATGTAIALGLAGAGTFMQVRGQKNAGDAERRAGEAQQRAAESQAELSEYNAEVAELQARDAVVRGELDANRFRRRTAALIGEQRAGFAAGNIDVGFGSAVDVQADSAFVGELDALTVRTNAAREAWGYKVEAEDLRRRAEITRDEGSNAAAAGRERQSASRWGMASTILTSGTSLLEAHYGFGRGRG